MKIIGLTGAMGAGKTFVAEIFNDLGVPVFDADAEIHKLMEPDGEAVIPVAELFPEALTQSMEINRRIIGEAVFRDPAQLKQLESILHPLVRKKGEQFIKEAEKAGKKVIVQDIPLLFETGADKICDITITVTVSPQIQKDRVMAREGMTEEKFESIKKLQLSGKEKEKMADYKIDSAKTREEISEQIKDILKKLGV